MYSVLYTFTDVDDLRKVSGGGPGTAIASTVMGTHWPLDNDFTVYQWDYYSTASETLPDVVWPTDLDTMAPRVGAGRWVKVESLQTAPQVNSDWTATSGVTSILNKPTLFSGAYSDLTGKPTYAAVATSGSYNDLTAKPSIPSAQVNADWTSNSGVTQVLNKPTLATVATSGSYIDLSNKPTIPTIVAPSQSGATRSLNTAFQVSTTRQFMVTYSGSITTTANIAGGQDGSIILEIASDSGFTSNVQTLSSCRNSQTYTLAVAIQGVQINVTPLHGFVPIGYYVRLRTVSTTGSPTFAFVSGQEVLF